MTALTFNHTANRPCTGAFALRHADNCHYLFGWTGLALRQFSGRALRDHDFLGLWQPKDRAFLHAWLDGVRITGQRKTIYAKAHTLYGETRDCHFEFSKLDHQGMQSTVLGCRWGAKTISDFSGTPIAGLMLNTVTKP